ncbi:MAG: efflux RND transporter periplasmic adaptor subunit [Acidobacteria bacterium]|nr:efflux RND transporter periplasmic adaptor subunit [Acidobacteriota bacterium]
MMKTWPRFLLLFLILGAGGTWWWAASHARLENGFTVAARGDFSVLVRAGGTLEAAIYYEMGPPSVKDVWNYNLTWMVPEGALVKAAQVVARFDAQDLEDRLRDDRAELETVTQEKEKEQRELEIQLKQLDLDLVEAQAEVEMVSVEASVPDELVPALELAQTRRRKALAEERVVFLKAKLQFQRDLVRSKLKLLDIKKQRMEQKIEYFSNAREKFEVKAPINGVVLYIPKRNGGRWEIGERVWMMHKILKVADISTLRVDVKVLEVDAARIKIGQPARVTVDALPGQEVQTRVAEVGRMVHERSIQDSTKVFDVYLPLAELNEAMRPGMSVTVAIQVARQADAVIIPVRAVISTRSGTFVDILKKNGGRQRTPVVLGSRQDNRVEVLEGLEGGERLSLPARGET